MTTRMKGGSANTPPSNLLKGLTRYNPPESDASMRTPKGPTVDAEATRDGTAPSPRTLGPRDA